MRRPLATKSPPIEMESTLADRRIALITGAASNIGLAIARNLARDHVVILADIVDTTALAKSIGEGAVAMKGDVSSVVDCTRWVERAAQLGGLNVLVNSAGITRETVPAGEIRLED